MKRVLLDESVPRQLARVLEGYVVSTVQAEGWSGLKNGDLLRTAMELFDVVVTADRGMRYQQNLTGIDVCVVVMVARSNRLSDLLPLVPDLRAAMDAGVPGSIIEVPAGQT